MPRPASGYVHRNLPFCPGTDFQFQRLFSFAQIFFFALTYMSSWEAIASNIAYFFWNGGPRAIVWGYLIVFAGVLCQVASMAEM
jgi:choline transport protein